MGVKERLKLIERIESQLDARVLVIVTGDRQGGMETRLAPDILPLVSEHLSRIGRREQLALCLYTPGGDSIAAWGLVNLIRQYCKRFFVVVPFRCLSAGTLIALGADEIIMGRHGLLSPVDPSVNSPFNPAMPRPQGGAVSLPVSVEDMVGFLDLARNEVGLKTETSLVEVLKLLTAQIHPLALGAVYRAREQSGSLAMRLLQHIKDEAKRERIVTKLTRELPTHGYLIGREEAIKVLELDTIRKDISEEIEGTLWALYRDYEDWLKLTRPASDLQDIGTERTKVVHYERAVIESLRDGDIAQHIYVMEKELLRVGVAQPGLQGSVEQVAGRIVYQGWSASLNGKVEHA